MKTKIFQNERNGWIGGEAVVIRWFVIEAYDGAGRLRSLATASTAEHADEIARELSARG